MLDIFVYILRISVSQVREIMLDSQFDVNAFQQNYLSKKSNFYHYLKLPSFCFLEEKPLDFVLWIKNLWTK